MTIEIYLPLAGLYARSTLALLDLLCVSDLADSRLSSKVLPSLFLSELAFLAKKLPVGLDSYSELSNGDFFHRVLLGILH